MRFAAFLLTVLVSTACSSTPESKPDERSEAPDETKEPVVGDDRDAHGCIGSAGYAWCERTKECVRPWEVAAANGFDNDPATFAAWCRL